MKRSINWTFKKYLYKNRIGLRSLNKLSKNHSTEFNVSNRRFYSSIPTKSKHIDNIPYESYLKATKLHCDSCGINLQFEDSTKPGFNNSKKVFDLDPASKNLCVRCHNMYEYNSINSKLDNYDEDFKPFKYEDVKNLITFSKVKTVLHFVSADQFPLGFNLQLLRDYGKESKILLVITKADTVYSNKILKKYYLKYFRRILKEKYPGFESAFDALEMDMLTNFPTFNNEKELDPMKFITRHLGLFKVIMSKKLKEGNYLFGETNSGKTVFLNNLLKLGNGFILKDFNDLKSERKLKKLPEIDDFNKLPNKKLLTFGCSPMNNTTRKERFFYFEKWNIKLVDLPGFSFEKLEILKLINSELIKPFLSSKSKKKFTPLANTEKVQISCSKPFDPRPKEEQVSLNEEEILNYRKNEIPIISLDGLIIIKPPSSGNIIIHNKATYTKPRKFESISHFKHTKQKYHENPKLHPDIKTYIKTNKELMDPESDFQMWIIPPFKRTVDLIVESLGIVKLEWDNQSHLDPINPFFIVYLPKGLKCIVRKDTESMAFAFKESEKRASKKKVANEAGVFKDAYEEDLLLEEKMVTECYKVNETMEGEKMFEEVKKQYEDRTGYLVNVTFEEFLQDGKKKQLFWTSLDKKMIK